jgi:hypothetical protein
MNRAELLNIVTENAVKELESLNCEMTGRLMQAREEHLIEYCADLDTKDLNGDDIVIQAYYYIDKEWVESLGDDADRYEDLADWNINHYEVL